MIFLNDQRVDFCGTLEELLKKQGYNIHAVAVLVNDEVIKKDQWSCYQLKDNDRVDVVAIMGGGALYEF
ncbi:sulfur carrier protein ThiS [Caldanaerobius polysaccharolyticus]|uniref:sulfur carrier protein ThiS n=1 Tax=Caldanaerobius polysaccharolyticus TaxID=44256 RepID=UPI00047C7544|nr:sulfur carrier protein ThiS [Caldanaerobius polysaccharolyticus]